MWKRVAQLIVMAIAPMVATAAESRAHDLYHVDLSPPDHVGQKFDYSATESESARTWRQQGKSTRILSTQGTALEFHSLVKVEACDQRGMPSQLNLTVLSLQPAGINVLPLIEPGTELTAHAAQVESEPPKYRDVFEQVNGMCNPLQEYALRRVITIGGATESSEQQAFGTDKPLAIGGTWSLDGEPGVRLLAKLQIKADPKHVKGTAQLAKISLREGVECLEVHMSVTCDEYPTPIAKDQGVTSSTAHCDLTYYIAKGTGRVVEATYHSKIQVEVEVPESTGVHTNRSVSETERTIKISDPLKVAHPFN